MLGGARMTNTLRTRAETLAATENKTSWAVADLAAEGKRNRHKEPDWATIIGAPFAVGPRWIQHLARTVEFCEVDCVAALAPRHNLRLTHWVELAAYWKREGVDVDMLVEIASDAIAESTARLITVDELKTKLRACFGFPVEGTETRRMSIYSQNVYEWAERRGKRDKLYPRLMACAAELKALAEEMSK